MPFHRRAHGFADDQPDVRRARLIMVVVSPKVDDEIGLRRPHPVPHRRVELGGPPHAVARRKHRQNPALRSGSQSATALAAPVRHNRTSGAGAHPQAETVHPSSAPVVRLKSPLALGHDVSSLCLASSGPSHPAAPAPSRRVGRRWFLLAGRRGPQAHHPRSQPYRRRSGDCLRVLTCPRWVKLGLRQRTRWNAAEPSAVVSPAPRPIAHASRGYARATAKLLVWNAAETVGSRTENC